MEMKTEDLLYVEVEHISNEIDVEIVHILY